MSIKTIIAAVIGVLLLIVVTTGVSVNDNGYRTVVQYPTGYTFIKFEPGMYLTMWGSETVYPDNVTFDFQIGEDSAPLPVRYQDGGKGTVEGISRFQLPSDEPTMLALHKAFRGEQGLRNKILNITVEEALNLTAGLMTSEEAYAEKKALFGDLAKDQVSKGKYKTVIEPKNVTLADGTVQKTNVPVIVVEEDGSNAHYLSDLVEYGITTSSFQVKEWHFEPKTLEFIKSKRNANMAIITAQASTKKSEQEKLQVIAEGEKAVAFAKYKEEEKKITAEVQAERIKSVALIEASQQTAKAKELTAAAKETTKQKAQLALAAIEEGKAIKTIANAEAHARKVKIEADNALKLRLQNDLDIAKVYADGMAKMHVPSIMIRGAGQGGSEGATELQQLLQFEVIKSAQSAAESRNSRSVGGANYQE